ncbi:hypothetical protein [Diaphorobacter aerolatus]|uniref:Uncharacterized protein n=1 Tax=Diaphorobacter aerolatus TaxID=1288495 RepID=A0A7H0GKU5_9BURK|nr:hypothetical protein [Diaphorobacter aerolatus]QNP48911.1 hypothetical protein H9K75_01530 [Diaphorobacter aerolatus]
MTEFENKAHAFIVLNVFEQMLELGRIIHNLSMAARDTYEIGSGGVTNPGKLRRINEVIQRISSLQLSVASDNKEDLDSFIQSSFEMLELEIEDLKIPGKFFR